MVESCQSLVLGWVELVPQILDHLLIPLVLPAALEEILFLVY